jgi:aryl-alcohol dehydrogenase-like predicted oxidoreductase
MNLSHAYGTPPSPDVAARVLLDALDLGVTFFDTAALYGFGANEELLGRVLSPHRSRFVLATKCGIWRDASGQRTIDSRPEVIARSCDESLQRLQTDVIDLFYLHRWDKRVPIEESVGAMKRLVEAGKIRAIGLSEVSAATLRKAHAVHPVAALQTEYSLWTRNAEIAVLGACRALGVGFVAFSPLARGFLCGTFTDPSTELEAKDLRRQMPRFDSTHYPANVRLIDPYRAIARDVGCSMAQLALAWILAKDPGVVPIPGTRRPEAVRENVGAAQVHLPPEVVARLDALINESTVSGGRYNDVTQLEIDTETF